MTGRKNTCKKANREIFCRNCANPRLKQKCLFVIGQNTCKKANRDVYCKNCANPKLKQKCLFAHGQMFKDDFINKEVNISVPAHVAVGSGQVPLSLGPSVPFSRLCTSHKMAGMEKLGKVSLCDEPDCKRGASFNFSGEIRGQYCANHKKENMKRIVPICEHFGCGKMAVFGFPTLYFKPVTAQKRRGRKPSCMKAEKQSCQVEKCAGAATHYKIVGEGVKEFFCENHKMPQMLKILRYAVCAHEGCDVQASFGDAISRKRLYCQTHREPHMVYIGVKHCEAVGCDRRAYYNFDGQATKKFCSVHMQEGMVMVVKSKGKKICDEEGCPKRPCFNFPGKVIPLVCRDHMQKGMIFTSTSVLICEHEGCSSKSEFNFPSDETKRRFCWLHKQEGMVMLGDKRCLEPGCMLKPRFNHSVADTTPSNCQPLYCSKHKRVNMEDVVTPRCSVNNCGALPSFQGAHKKNRHIMVCRLHKEKGMTPIKDLRKANSKSKEEDSPAKSQALVGRYCANHYAQLSVTQEMCKKRGCGRRPIWAPPGERERQYCYLHKTKGMVHLKFKLTCMYEGCEKEPSYNFKGNGAKRKFCAAHKFPGMVDISSKDCEVVGCEIRARYNLPGIKLKRFCYKHKLPGMSRKAGNDPVRLICHIEGCDKKPVYYLPGADRPSHCTYHKQPGSTHEWKLRNICQEDGCKAEATHNFEGETRRRYCANHKLGGMICLKHEPCAFPGCEKRPWYNFPAFNQPIFCSVHSKQGMVRVGTMSQFCEVDGCAQPRLRIDVVPVVRVRRYNCKFVRCTRSAKYGEEGDTVPGWCKDHKSQKMVLILSKKECAHRGCHEKPIYAEQGKRVGLFCADHKMLGMVDVTTKQCDIEDCTSHGGFVDDQENPTVRRCLGHKLPGMVNAAKHSFCERIGCKKFPRYNFGESKQGRFCHEHKIKGMINVRGGGPLCQVAGCEQTAVCRYLNARKVSRCYAHRKEGMVDIRDYCAKSGCTVSIPHPIGIREKVMTYCPEHIELKKEPEIRPLCMVEGCTIRPKRSKLCKDHKQRKKYYRPADALCQFKGCYRKPICNYRGELKKLFCPAHKHPGMVKLVTCKFEGCIKYPSYNFTDTGKRLYCKDHKLDGMVINKFALMLCKEPGCTRAAMYNWPGHKGKYYCRSHKLDGMISRNSKNMKCKAIGCKKVASYNFPGAVGKRFCQKHKLDGMYCKAYVPCEAPGCPKKPYYRYITEVEARFCSSHKYPGMVYAKNHRTCEVPNCEAKATGKHRFEKKRRRCSAHLEPGMIDYGAKRSSMARVTPASPPQSDTQLLSPTPLLPEPMPTQSLMPPAPPQLPAPLIQQPSPHLLAEPPAMQPKQDMMSGMIPPPLWVMRKNMPWQNQDLTKFI